VTIRRGQKVRFKRGSRFARAREISTDAPGTVICRYRVLWEDESAADRLDVRFSPQLIVWAVSEREFELITEDHVA
jgi:hypothetical protein